MKKIFANLGSDLPSSLVVFLVALPLCLGVGLSSTSVEGMSSNVFSGIIAGIIGGIVVGLLSGSRVGVSGPAAGLILIVASAIATLGSFEAFLLAVVLAGIIQIIAGYIGLGIIGNYFPSSVIKGMLAAIGITLILKEIPRAVGYDKDYFGDESFFQLNGETTFSAIQNAFQNAIHPGAVLIFIVSLAILILFETVMIKKIKFMKFIPGALIVVVVGILLNQFFATSAPAFYLFGDNAVNLPVLNSISEIGTILKTPDFSAFKNPQVYVIAATIALIGSLETLLSVEATDKIDPEKSITPTNRELKAQGVGNIVSGLIGGIPITQVIVRSSANVNAGVKSKASTVLHGVLLALSVLLIPGVLNMVPLAALSAILFLVGYKLAKVSLFTSMYKLGWDQFIPFIATVVGVVFKDLLFGIGIGMAVAIFFILKKNYKNDFQLNKESNHTSLILTEEVSFLNKAGIVNALAEIKDGEEVTIDCSNSKIIDHDVIELIWEFVTLNAKERNITVNLINVPTIDLELIGAGKH